MKRRREVFDEEMDEEVRGVILTALRGLLLQQPTLLGPGHSSALSGSNTGSDR